MTNEERIQRAKEAQAVLENPAYLEAVGRFTHDIRALRLQLSPRDSEGASRLVFMEQSVEKAKRLMEMYLSDGEAARKELSAQASPTPIGRLTGRLARLTQRGTNGR
jgi:hypothetical protein